MQKSIKKDYFWNTIGVFAQNAISPLLLVAVTRINGIYDSGVFSFAFSLAVIFWALGMWGGRTYQVSDVQKQFSYQSYIIVRCIMAFVMLTGALLFCLLNQYDLEKTSIIIALVIFKIIESIADAIYGILQVHDRLYEVGKSLLCKAVLGLSAFILIDFATKSIFLGCLGVLAVNLIVVLTYDIPRVHALKQKIIIKKHLKVAISSSLRIMKRCAPIALIIFLVMFSLNIPRYFIDLYHANEVGVFGIIAMPVTLLALVITFILQPNITQLSKLFDQHEYAKFSQIVNKLVAAALILGIIILIITALIGIQALQLIFGINFSEYGTILITIVAGAILGALVTIYINILTIMRYFKAQFYVLVGTNVLLVIVAASVIQRYSLEGGVILYSLANLVQVILLFCVYKYFITKALYKKPA